MKKRAPHIFKDIKTVAARDIVRAQIARHIAEQGVQIEHYPIIHGRDIKFNPRSSKEVR